MNLFKQAIRREIYLFMFMLGGGWGALSGQLRSGADGRRVQVVSNERWVLPPPSTPPSRCRTGPRVPLRAQQLVRWEKLQLHCISSPAFPVLTAGRCLRLVLELAPYCVLRAEMPVEIAARIFAIFTWLQCRRRRLHEATCFFCARENERNRSGKLRTIGSSPLAHSS